ncbi:MAG: hypothetical protein HC842_01530 [Cytophagales bacterium]|nr:hypothetical protein [Cytophagales bacterium]
MVKIRKNIVPRLVCFIMALHVLNLSVDAPDALPDHIPEDLSINDIESIVELMLEQLLGIEDAMDEKDEWDDCVSLDKKFSDIHYCLPDTQCAAKGSLTYRRQLYPFSVISWSAYLPDKNSPPPKG